MKLVRAAACAWILLGTPSLACAEEPAGFGKFPWGTLATALAEHCGRDVLIWGTGPSPMIHCRAYENDADAVGRAYLHFRPLDAPDRHGLEGYTISVDHAEYAVLRAVAVAKFGAPVSSKRMTYSNAMGGLVEGEEISWRWSSGVTASLKERSGTITQSRLFVATPSLLSDHARQERERADRAKGKF